MQTKKLSIYWSGLVGLLVVALQLIIFYARFGRWNTDAPLIDYLWLFIGGWLGGWLLITTLNKQNEKAAWWSVLAAFLVATPISLAFSIAGGMLGPVGVVVFPLIPWALGLWIGTLIGRFFTRGVG